MNNPANDPSAQRPLSGVKVLDLTHAYSGPFCTMHLADQGAQVIKLEMPGHGDQSRGWAPFKNDSSGYYAYINRNKYGLTLDLKSEEGKRIFKQLVTKVDVVCENFRVGTMEKLGLGYDVLKELNPGLIYASISGFGTEGPRAKQPCYDIIAQAMGGMMSMTGFGSQLTKVGPAIADNYSGTYLALGIAMALYQKSRTGLGRRVDVSMLDTVFSILETAVVDYTICGEVAKPVGNRDPGISPFDAYDAADGAFVIACGTDKFFRALCEVMEMPQLADDAHFATNSLRCQYYESELKGIIADWAARHTLAELEESIVAAGIPFGRVLTMDRVCELDELQKRSMLWTVHDHGMDADIRIPGTPIKMHGCDDSVQRSAPNVGEHTTQLLQELLDMDKERVEALRSKGII